MKKRVKPLIEVFAEEERKAFFPTRLRELRAAAKMTQTELAARCGVRQNTVARWEMGIREPPYGVLSSLATALGVGVEKLFP